MSEIIERFKVAAQEAHRVSTTPKTRDPNEKPVLITLSLDPRGVLVLGEQGGRAHRYVVPYEEIEAARINLLVAQIGQTVDILSC